MQRLNEQVSEKTKQFDALKAQFDPLFEQVAELKKAAKSAKNDKKVHHPSLTSVTLTYTYRCVYIYIISHIHIRTQTHIQILFFFLFTHLLIYPLSVHSFIFSHTQNLEARLTAESERSAKQISELTQKFNEEKVSSITLLSSSI